MINKLLNLINPSRTWESKKMLVAGTRPATEKELGGITLQEGEIGFVVIATTDGTLNRDQYVSETLYSQPDDIWLTGAIDGKSVIVLVDPENKEKYKVKVNDLEPVSQYS